MYLHLVLLILIFVFILGNLLLLFLEKKQKRRLPITNLVNSKIIDSKIELLDKRLAKLEIEENKKILLK